MDFKNFIDILSTPKNLGTNKWVLANFSDLKSSNDYLHIVRLRYDNRWLRVYWDGKLREVEKEPNFYSTLPIKNKLFFPKAVTVGKSILLESPLRKLPTLGGDFSEKTGNVGETAPLLKNFRGAVENSEVFSPLLKVNYKNFYNTNLTTSSLEATLTNYRFAKNFYTKNSKNIVESLEGLTSLDNLWALNKNNSATRVYPNLVKTLLSGNLLIGVKESEGGFNTNLISVRDPIWSAVDRYFLNFSKKILKI